MGYRGKTVEQQRARELRARSWTLQEIADELGVSRSSVSLWVRDVVFDPKPRQRPLFRKPSSLHLKKLAEIEAMNQWGREQIGTLSDDAFLAAGAALYAGEGSKRDGEVEFANTDTAMMAFFCAWLRRHLHTDESRLRARVNLHDGLDLDAAQAHWSAATGVPRSQFRQRHRAAVDPTIRTSKHEYGCAYVGYGCATTHRKIMV